MENDTRKLASASTVMGICAVTLLPVHPGLATGLRENGLAALSSLEPFLGGTREVSLFDMAQNILLFLPLGFFLASAADSRKHPFRRLAPALWAGLLLSGAVETLQVLIPGRYPSFLDILLNALGSLAGAYAAHKFRPPSPSPGTAHNG